MSTVLIVTTHPYPYGHGWRWVEGYREFYGPSKEGCLHCQSGGSDRTPDPSGEDVAYTVYHLGGGGDVYPHYSCKAHLTQFEKYDSYTYYAVPGIWKPEDIVDLRGLPVDRGHLHPKVKHTDVFPPGPGFLRLGAMAATLGGMGCPWCDSSCTEEHYLAVCKNDPSHKVQWLPWPG